MNEYYTTQSLATAAAAIEQGFEGCETRIIGYTEWTKQFIPSALGILEHRFPRTTHNVALMDAREGDFVKTDIFVGKVYEFEPIYGEENLSSYWKDCRFTVFWGGNEVESKYDSEKDVIIYRNNKPFPVWDKEIT